MTPTRRVLVAVAVLDLLFFGGWVLKESLARQGEGVHFPIAGYDPRDLLSGHYVRFQLVAERELTPHLGDGVQAICIAPDSAGLMHLGAPRTIENLCAQFLTLQSDQRPRFGVDRFYVDERKAAQLQVVREGPDTYLVATLDSAGGIHPVELVLEGKPVGAARR